MKSAHSSDAARLFLDIAQREDANEKLAYAVAAYTAAALNGYWNAWLSAALVLEQNGDCDQEVSLFYRSSYFDALCASADKGDVVAINRLAGLYEFGQPGLQADPKRALEHFERAADMGDPVSMFELFEKYFYGLCSARADKEAALKWLRLAAEAGHIEAGEWILRLAEWDRKGVEYPSPSSKIK